jgi:chemotaxis family two-component system sensor kinase Cph1
MGDEPRAATAGDGVIVTESHVELSNCDRELVQFSGAVQPHGALLVLSEPDLHVLQASANCPTLLGTPPAGSLPGQPVAGAIGPDQAELLRNRLARYHASLNNGPVHLLRTELNGRFFDMFAHRVEAGLIVEFEAVAAETPALLDLFSDLQVTIAELQAIQGLPAFLDLACVRIRQFTGYDRVMAYKFLGDGSGHVVAESRIGGIEPYLNLRYPAADIPAPARRLFTLSWLRHLPDAGYEPVPLVPVLNPATGRPLDQSRGLLRSVSAMYIEYRRNMGTQSALVMPLMKSGALWGLISCMHHSSPLHVPYERRKACELLAHTLSLLMAAKEDAENEDCRLRVAAVTGQLAVAMTNEAVWHHALRNNGESLLGCLDAAGAAVATSDGLELIGRTPGKPQVQKLIEWLAAREDGNPIFASNRIGSLYPPAAAFEHAAGLLAVRLMPHRADYLLWFRPEIEQTEHWAGDPDKPAEVTEVDGEIRLSPRRSFALWKQSVHGQSAPWRDIEIEAAANLRRVVVQEVIMRQSRALEAANRELSRSNAELDSFAHIASHDLKEPLRQIETFGTLLERVFDNRSPRGADPKLWCEGIQASSRRLRSLIDDLAEYSRVGRASDPFTPWALNDMLDDVKADLGVQIGALGATIRSGALPVIMCDGVQMRQVMQNLISNALKYRHPDRVPEISVGAVVRQGTLVAGSPAGPLLELTVTDNGVGFDQRHSERIFEPFQRLHSAGDYEGSGIGLAICRKIIDRHGGTVTAASRPGEGSAFTITLPMRPIPNEGATG